MDGSEPELSDHNPFFLLNVGSRTHLLFSSISLQTNNPNVAPGTTDRVNLSSHLNHSSVVLAECWFEVS